MKRKVNLSLSTDIDEMIDGLAAYWGTNRSAAVSRLVRDFAERMPFLVLRQVDLPPPWCLKCHQRPQVRAGFCAECGTEIARAIAGAQRETNDG